MYRVLALIASAAFLAGCGGGGSHAVPSSGLASPGSSGSGAQGTARFTLTIPTSGVLVAGKGRTPQYVSASTLSAAITANPGNITTDIDLSIASPLCTNVSGGRACTLPVTAPIGSDHFSMVLYSGACTGGPPCTPTGTPLSAASNFGPITVAEGQTNVTAPLVLGGIPTSVDVAIGGSLVAGTPATLPVFVTAYDASSNVIVGPANYADATGAAAPLTVTLGTTQQLLLHDGAQAATSITVAGPSDTVTLQLEAPANILGTYLTVKNNASVTLPAANLTRFVALNGTLTSTLLIPSVGFAPDDTYYAPADNTLVTGVPNGIAFSFTSQSGGGALGYFNSATENDQFCTVSSGFTLGIGAITNGIVSAFNGADNVGTPPTGLTFYPLTQLTNAGPTCAGGTSYTSDTTGFAKSLAFDATRNELFEGDNDGDLGVNTFTPPVTIGGNSVVGTFGGNQPHDLIAVAGTTYYLTGTTNNSVRALNPIIAATAAGDQLSALRNGEDGRIYALGAALSQVWVYNGTSNLQPYTPASAFSITLSTQPNNLAIGPDGRAYATDGASQIQAVTPAGAQATLIIPAPGGNVGFLKGIFDGHNGYLYAPYDDGLHAGREYFYRISY